MNKSLRKLIGQENYQGNDDNELMIMLSCLFSVYSTPGTVVNTFHVETHLIPQSSSCWNSFQRKKSTKIHVPSHKDKKEAEPTFETCHLASKPRLYVTGLHSFSVKPACRITWSLQGTTNLVLSLSAAKPELQIQS